MRSPIGAGMRHSQQVLVAMAAIRDGWGDPAAWLRETEAFFAAGGYERAARRCRTLIGEAGAPVPRRRSDATVVPPSLRALGVTSREVDVLALVVEGRTTREIADRLYLSPKTVDRHLSNLFDRTGVRDRVALADLARSHGLGVGDPPVPYMGDGFPMWHGSRRVDAAAMQTNIHEIADGVYRLSTCVPDVAPGGFTFNQYLIDADEPFLFHTGPRQMFDLVAPAAAPGDRHRAPPVDLLRPRRVRRVRSDEPLARGGSRSRR